MNLSNIKFDDQSNEKINYILKSLIFKKNKLQNKIYLKKKINEAIKSYVG